MRLPPRMAARRGLGADKTNLLSRTNEHSGSVEPGSKQPKEFLPTLQRDVLWHRSPGAVAPVTRRGGTSQRIASGYRPMVTRAVRRLDNDERRNQLLAVGLELFSNAS